MAISITLAPMRSILAMRAPLFARLRRVAYRTLPFFALLLFPGCAFEDPRNILTAGEPAEVISYELRDHAGIVLWRISSTRPRHLTLLNYGVVPPGFTQSVPAPGERPRPLRNDEILLAVTDLAERILEHRGHAVGVDGFLGGAYLSSPKHYTPPAGPPHTPATPTL